MMFSVVMPLYNHEAFVGQSIDSVLQQTLRDWRMVIVDDGSTDHSGGIADQAALGDSRISVIHQANAGAAAARNRGLKAADGDWIAFLDSDDIWFPQTLARYAEFIARHPEARLIYGYRHRLRDGQITELKGRHQDRVTSVKELFEDIYMESSSAIFHRSLLEAAGPLDESLPIIEDYEFFLRLSLHSPLHPLGQATGLRRRHEHNLSRPCGENRMQEASVLERFAARPEAQALLDGRRVAARLARVYHAAGRQFTRQGDRAAARQALSRSLGLRFTFRTWLALQAARCGV